MENILMRYLREINHYTTKTLAKELGMTTHIYKAIEKGDVLMTRMQAKQLGNWYKTNPSYFYTAAQQLDLILTRKTVIKILKSRIDLLEEQLKSKNSTE